MIKVSRERIRTAARRAVAGLALSGLLTLGACGLFEDPPPPCPRIAILGQANKLTLYRDGPGRDLTDVTFEVEVRDVAWACEYDFDDEEGDSVLMEYNVLISATKGPAADSNEVEVPYFVVIADPTQRITAKEIFNVKLEFEKNTVRAQAVEELRQTIPIAREFIGTDYDTFIGLQFTREQLQDQRRERGSRAG